MDRLLAAASARRWDRAEKLISPDFRDAWGNDRSQALAEAREFGRHFLFLDIMARGDARIVRDADGGREWRGKLEFSGRGNAYGEMLLSRAQDLRDEFLFVWRRESWLPWSWVLVSAAQPEIQKFAYP